MKNVLKINNSTTVTRVKEGSFRYIEQVSEEGIGIRYGGVIACQIEAQCYYLANGTAEISEGDVLYYYQEYDVDADFNAVTPSRQLLIGVFTVEKCTHENFSYSFVAYDNIHKLSADFSRSLYSQRNFFPMPLKAFMMNFASFCGANGITLDLTTCNCFAYAQDMNINRFYTAGISARDVLSYIAEFCMQYIRCNQTGDVVFASFSNAPRTGYTQWGASDDYIIAPTDQSTYLDDNNQPLTPVYYKQHGLSRAEYYFADIDDYQVLLSDGSILYRDSFTPLNDLLNPYCIVENIITNSLNQDDAWWMDASYAGYAALQSLVSSHNVTPFEVHLFPFRCPFSAGQIIPYIEDSKGNRFQSVVMKLELTDSEVVLSCAGPEYYYTDSAKNNDVAETVTSLGVELDGKVNKKGDTMTGGLSVNSYIAVRRASGNAVAVDDTSADSTSTPGSNKNCIPVVFRDQNNVAMGAVRAIQQTDGKNGLNLYGSNNGNSNYLMLTVDSNGNSGVSLNAPNAWRDALSVKGWKNSGNINSNNPGTITCTGAFHGMIVTSAAYASLMGVYLVFCNSATSTPVVKTVVSASNLTLTPGTSNGKIVITSNSTANTVAYLIGLSNFDNATFS